MKGLKASGWMPQKRPAEDSDIKFHRQMINEIVFSIFQRKKAILAKMSMPPQPVSLREIWKEYQSRVAQLEAMKLWKNKKHGKRWLDRRVNECYAFEFYNGIPKLIATTAGKVEPNFNPMVGDLI